MNREEFGRMWASPLQGTILASAWGTDENYSQDCQNHGQDLNLAPPKNKSEVLLLFQPA
jgi:hypothetical protein